MKIYTGYFSKLKLYEENGLIPISIARYTPKWFNGLYELSLAPSAELLNKYKNNQITEKDYSTQYLNYLNTIDVKHILEHYKMKYNNQSIIFCCYEKPDNFCHRFILSEYILHKYHVKVNEFN